MFSTKLTSYLCYAATALILVATTTSSWAVNQTRHQTGSSAIDAAFGAAGSGVVIGQIELGVPQAHNDIPCTPRAGDAATTDLYAMQVAGVMVSGDTTFTGMAPNASLFSDNYTNNGIAAGTIAGAGTSSENNFLDGIDWLTGRGAKVINASIGMGTSAPNSKATLGLDNAISGGGGFVSRGGFLFTKSAANNGTSPVTKPGSQFNGLTVGAVTSEDYQVGTLSHQGPANRRWEHVANFSNFGGAGGVSKPDIVAPGARVDTDDPVGGNSGMEVGINLATAGNAFASNAGASFVGTSYAAPHVAGIAAQLYEKRPFDSHRTMKAVLMNAADKTVRGIVHGPAGGPHGTFWRQSDPAWSAGAHGLDPTSGAGMVNAWGSMINLVGSSQTGVEQGFLGVGATEAAKTFTAGPDTRLVATVTWDRAVTRTESPDPVNRPQDYTFMADAQQPHFSLATAGPQVITQNTAGGSVQHINKVLTSAGNYTLNVMNNTGGGSGPFSNYSVAWAVSPVDVNPGTQNVFFTVRDWQHAPRAERTSDATVNDRIVEGRSLSAVNLEATLDASHTNNFGVETRIYKSTMNASNTNHSVGRFAFGLSSTTALNDDAINALSFGRDDVLSLRNGGSKLFFSVDTFATGLSPVLVDNPETGVFDEATIVNEAAGDIFQSHILDSGASPLTNQNSKTKNSPNSDYLHPRSSLNQNSTYADSYYMGLVGGRVADNEDDVTSLEGLGVTNLVESSFELLETDMFTFFSLDRDSPSTMGSGATASTSDILVGRADMPGEFRKYATGVQLGLLATDNIDAMAIQHLSGMGSDGWPVYDPSEDWVLFSVDRDSVGAAGSALFTEHTQGEVAGDLFLGSGASPTNLLFLEATDLGLQEVALGSSQNWLSDNLDALDLADVMVVPEPSTIALSLLLAGVCSQVLRAQSRLQRT